MNPRQTTRRVTRVALVALAAAAPLACSRERAPESASGTPQDSFWSALQALCGNAYAGTIRESSPADTTFANRPLLMHVRQCTDDEIRIPFHVGEDRSRTWVLTRTATGLRLKHDHRHEDGSEDAITQYGGDTSDPGTSTRQQFPADDHTAALVPLAATNVWTVEVHPADSFVYALRREGTNRRFRVAFDLRAPIPAPPPPW